MSKEKVVILGTGPAGYTAGIYAARANLEPLVKRLGQTVRLQAKKASNMQCMIGKDTQSDDEIVANILAVYNTVVKQLPNEMQNIKNVALKLTMSKPVKLW